MNRNQIIGAFVVLIIVGGGAFYAGMSYGGSKAAVPNGFTMGTGGAGGAGGFPGGRTGARGAAGGGFTAGTIVSSGSGTISIQQQNGSSTEIVLVGPSTQIFKTVAGSASDLSVGTMKLPLPAPANSDGSMTASSIQVRPSGI
jgi:hypothetical protein